MKKCSYCGRENTDPVTRCVECGTDEFTDAGAQPARVGTSTQERQRPDTLVRDYPKPIIVVGMWIFFLPAFFGNLSLSFAALFGELGLVQGVLFFFISLGCAALWGYVLYRAVKNYKIHRDRLCHEISNEARAETGSLASPSPS